MAKRSKKKSAKVNYEEIFVKALTDLIIGTLLLLIAKIIK